jgi:hypothetical protein
MILALLTAGKVEVVVDEEAELPLRGEEVKGKDPVDFLDSDVEMPPISGQVSGLIVRRELIEVEALEILEAEDGIPRLRVRPAGGTRGLSSTFPRVSSTLNLTGNLFRHTPHPADLRAIFAPRLRPSTRSAGRAPRP